MKILLIVVLVCYVGAFLSGIWVYQRYKGEPVSHTRLLPHLVLVGAT
jgi:hypothetical protein